MVGKINENLMMKMLEFIPEGGISVHQIACKTGWDHRTIKKYVQLIVNVQSAPRIRMESVGFRVLVRKEKSDSPKTQIGESSQSREVALR